MADPVNVALDNVRMRFFKSALEEAKQNLEAAATYAARLQECQARATAARAEADAELASMGIDPLTKEVELNEAARVLVVKDAPPKAPA